MRLLTFSPSAHESPMPHSGGGVRPSPPQRNRQWVAWSDGTSAGGSGGHGWLVISRGEMRTDIVLEALSGGHGVGLDSMKAEAFGLPGLAEGLRRRLQGEQAPSHWGECPMGLWAETYKRVLWQLRARQKGPWAQHVQDIEILYDGSWL